MRTRDGAPGYLVAGLAGAATAALILLSFPAVAAVGDALLLGRANGADAVTSLSGQATANLRMINTQAGSPALDLRVQPGAPPLKVNSTTRVPKLNADLLDGKHTSGFATATHAHDGVYLPVGEQAASAALLAGRDPKEFAGAGMACPPGASVVGYGRSGPLCSGSTGSVIVDSVGTVGQYSSLVLDASGYPVISYYDATNGALRVARCGDATCASATISTVDDTGDVGYETSLLLDALGYPLISYYDATTGSLWLAHCGDAYCSAGNTIALVDGAGDAGMNSSLALDASGYPVISYYNDTTGSLWLAHCGDAYCRAGNTIAQVDAGPDAGWGSSLALDSAGRPVVSYRAGGTFELRVAHCGNAACTAGNVFATIDDNIASSTSLALDPSGRPVISYYDDTSGDLKVARCGNAACAAGNTITTVAIGTNPSLVLGAYARPVVSYRELAGPLRVLLCGDATCSTGNVSVTVDGSGGTGWGSSLALDAAGHPAVAYYDSASGDLRFGGFTG